MQGAAEHALDWQDLKQERLELQRTGQRIPYISFVFIHVALALFLVTIFLIDRLPLDPFGRSMLRILLVGGAIVFLALAWAYAILLSHRFKHVVLRWSQMEVAYAQQERLNQLKDQFLNHVSHELRTPLTQLHGYLELLALQSDSIDQAMRAKFLEHATRSSGELIDIVSNVLDALNVRNNSDALHGAIISLVELVHDVLAAFTPQEIARYRIDVNIASDISVWANEQSLRQVLRNLLSNAFKYCPEQTKVSISARLMTATEAQAVTPQVQICISDTGPGVPLDEQGMLFHRFFRLQRDLMNGSIRGTGLGLYISKELIEAMGGRIWVESSGKEGEGSRFCLLLPDVSSTHVGADEESKTHI